METACAATRARVDDADVVGAAPAGAAAHAVAHLIELDLAAEFGCQAMQIDARHASASAAHGVQFEVGGEVLQPHTV